MPAENFFPGRNRDGSADHLGRQPGVNRHLCRGSHECYRREKMSGNRLIVMKFGGTSVGSAERFRQCAEIVRAAAEKDKIIVVVSAVAGVTDVILKTIEAARQGDVAGTDASLQKLESLHQALIAELFGDTHAHLVSSWVKQVLEQLRGSCHALLTLRSQISAERSEE